MRRITGRQGDIKYSQWIWDYCSGDINHQKGEKKKTTPGTRWHNKMQSNSQRCGTKIRKYQLN